MECCDIQKFTWCSITSCGLEGALLAKFTVFLYINARKLM